MHWLGLEIAQWDSALPDHQRCSNFNREKVFSSVSDPNFFANPDPGKNPHANPDPDPGGIRGVKEKMIFFIIFFSRFR